jgi:hypothetical protein
MEFARELRRRIAELSSELGLTEDNAFNFWFGTEILDIDEDLALEAISIEGSNDKGIDLFYVDHDEGRVYIVQGKWSSTLKSRPRETHVTKLQSCINWLMDPAALEKEGRRELAVASRDYLDAKKDGYGTELTFVYAGPKSVNIEKMIAVYNQNSENTSQRRNIRHYFRELLSDLWLEMHEGRKRIAKESIALSGGWHETDGGYGRALVVTLPGKELVRLYGIHGDTLFDRNVRLFLGARKGSVNAEIASTVKSPIQRGNFWAYNNGITIICDQFKVEKDMLHLSNFSIVNGCQTTVSLSEHGGDSSDIHVLARCIAAEPDIVDDVIRFTNSQNPIKTWDIASQNKTQRRLKRDFEQLGKPYIYLTRRGDRPSTNLKRFREGGRLRQIRIDEAGQFMAAYRGLPVLAYKHKAFIFSQSHETVFPPDVQCQEVLFAVLCGSTCRMVVREHIRQGGEEARILKKGGALFVLAILSEICRRRNGATFLSLLNEQRVTSTRTKTRIHKYAEFAAKSYCASVIEESGLKAEVELTTLIRQKEFFDTILNRSLRQYDMLAMSEDWLKGALPKLV